MESAELEQTLKSGHSLSLDGHRDQVPLRVSPQSCILKKMRSNPKIAVDTSYEAVQEEVNRNVLHEVVLSRNPQVFKRGGSADNFSRFNTAKHEVRNLLPDMHPVSDKKDICPPKFGYNFSKIKREEPELRSSIKDFLQPKDATHERTTGYNKGHIRAVLELDTFGPIHSEKVNEERSSGKLPVSPNLDRNRDSHSRGGTRSENSSMSPDGLEDSTIGSAKSTSHVVFGGTWSKDLFHGADDDKSLPLIRPSTSGYVQDARNQNLSYSKKRAAMLKEKAEHKRRIEEYKRDRQRQEHESKEFQKLISDFEAHLESIQY